MSVSPRQALALAALALIALASCVRPFGRQYEYEEEIYLDLDGSATIVVNSSMAALAALHGLDVPLDPLAPVERDEIRALYESPVTEVTRVSRPWRRDGRRFIQVRVQVPDVRQLSSARPFAWAQYRMTSSDEGLQFMQQLGAVAGRAVGDVGWDGQELVAIRLHLPSRVTHHNAPSREIERGNILTWEQPLKARLAGEPLEIDVRFGAQRILVLTVALFLAALVAAALTVSALIWWVVRKGRQRTAAAA